MRSMTDKPDAGTVTNEAVRFAADLRQLADIIERHPEIAGEYPLFALNTFLDSVDALNDLRARVGGQWEKCRDDHYLWLRYHISSRVYIDLNLRHEQVCERVQVGTRTVERPAPDAPTVTVEEPVYDWVCPPSLLAAGGES